VRRRVLGWLLWWAVSWWGFLLLAGDWNEIEWVAAACVATVTATLAELAQAVSGVRVGVPLDRLRHLPAAVGMVFVDFALLAAALVRSLLRRQVVRGRFFARDFPAGDPPYDAWTVLVAGLSPNAYVIDLDPERGTVLVHDLVPNRASERPA
jgi:hypothetical protein